MLCCDVPVIGDAATHAVLNNIAPCSEHGNQTYFICLEQSCEDHCLLCPICISGKHRDHSWQGIQDLLTDQIRNMITSGTSSIGNEVRLATLAIRDFYQTFSNNIKKRIDLVEDQLRKQTDILRERYPVNGRFGFRGLRMDQQNAVILKQIVQRQKNTAWIPAMQELVTRTLADAEITFDNVLEDLDNLFITQRWDQNNMLEEQLIIQDFREHLHPHLKPDPQYFRFSEDFKPVGIALDDQRLQATYFRQRIEIPYLAPNKLGLFAMKPFTREHNKVGFQIVKQTKALYLLSNILLCVGACSPTIAKNKNLRRLVQPTSGCYMIGNSGWTYHHKFAKYDRQSIVGWGFSEGQTVDVEMIFKDKGQLIFSKKGFFKKQFVMDLGLDERDMKHIHPIIYFDGSTGSKIKIINYPNLQQQNVAYKPPKNRKSKQKD